jgi:hypothetical protein
MTELSIDDVLDPAFIADLANHDADALGAMADEVRTLETEVSYLRRLAQGRIDILTAEVNRRASGGSLGDLIAALPQILAGNEVRPPVMSARMPAQLIPSGNLQWHDGLEELVADDTLANLPVLSDADLDAALAKLKSFEEEVSTTRRSLHKVIDAIETQLVPHQQG